MPSFTHFLGTVLRSIASGLAPQKASPRNPPRGTTPRGSNPRGTTSRPTTSRTSTPRTTTTRPAPPPSDATRTVEIDSRTLGHQKLAYAPHADARPDPGEVVWTWVPYEENDGRGKDRPMLVLARLSATTVLGIQLTSKAHPDDRGALELGPGPWDPAGRASWVRLDRLFRVTDAGMRREGAALDAPTYARVAKALQQRYRF
ncbi:type II toxin-antitoxin system PemK/MazF family toxin [Subtercola boreus]|uniref:type II toxin-antitoxin system PemK/MazF family toxin n=1 Tax=Subtercola boreus TaxID=120213 RepID=UPI00209C0AAB|nr:type II toxin-antitoxin system PemK/MazF family toxin [Subtercola boreus]